MRPSTAVLLLLSLLLATALPQPVVADEGIFGERPSAARPQDPGNAAAAAAQSRPPSLFRYGNYAGLSEMLAVVCAEAAKVFDRFYGPRVVMVKPFVFVTDTGKKRMTELGATMADQMLAMINRNTVDERLKGDHDQDLQGVLQEIDGYLRVHFSGVNLEAQRRSYTASIEMSEPLYRSLHASYTAR